MPHENKRGPHVMYTTHKEAFYFASWKALFICLKPPLFQKSLDFLCAPQESGFILSHRFTNHSLLLLPCHFPIMCLDMPHSITEGFFICMIMTQLLRAVSMINTPLKTSAVSGIFAANVIIRNNELFFRRFWPNPNHALCSIKNPEMFLIDDLKICFCNHCFLPVPSCTILPEETTNHGVFVEIYFRIQLSITNIQII